jgi:hypothetical protein
VPSSNLEFYGSVWAQEIAHNFARNHVGNSHGEIPPLDLNFPYPHGGIGEPGVAISTEWWNGSPFLIAPGIPSASGMYSHAHDFMSYGMVNNSTGEHTNSWVSPYTYGALFQKFELIAQAQTNAAPKRTEKIVLAGRILKDGRVMLRPSYLVTTDFVSGAGMAGDFSVELVGAGGRTLATHRFDARHIVGSHSLAFSELVPWNADTQVIVIRSKAGVLAKRNVSRHKPWVRIASPRNGEAWGRKATIAWEAGDEDGDTLTFAVFYNDGRDQTWIPIANNVTKPSAVIETELLPGSPRARIRVRVTDGVNTSEAESAGTFVVPEKRPLVAILGPKDGQVLTSEGIVRFIGAAYDPEDGMLPATSLTWTSDREGTLGHGPHVETRALSRGTHVVTLTATDKNGNSASARVNVVVAPERLDTRPSGAKKSSK